MQKRGQFFLLAAVIISAMIISLGVGTNRAITSEQPKNFYDFTYNVQKEIGAVVDYNVYSNFSDQANLTQFINSLAAHVEEKNPGSNFVIISGDNSSVTVRNYGTSSVNVNGGTEIKGKNAKSSSDVCIKKSCKTVKDKTPSPGGMAPSAKVFKFANSLNLNLDGSNLHLKLTSRPKVAFVLQKNRGRNRDVYIG